MGGVQVDAVEVVARLLRRDREPRLVDEPLEVACVDLELMSEIARGKIGEVLRRQRLQGEPGLTRGDRQALLVGLAPDLDLRTVGELAHDVVQDVGGHGHGARRRHVRADLLHDLALEVGRLELQALGRRAHQDVGQNRNGRAPLDDARDMAKRSQQLTPFDHQPHETLSAQSQSLWSLRPARRGPPVCVADSLAIRSCAYTTMPFDEHADAQPRRSAHSEKGRHRSMPPLPPLGPQPG